MIIDLHEKYDVNSEWFEEHVREVVEIAPPSVVEKLCLSRLCTLLSVYKVKDETGAKEAAERMKKLIDSPVIDAAME